MSWVRLDDQFHRNPKQLHLSDGAFRVWVCSWSYCAAEKQLTGFLSFPQAESLAGSLGKGPKAFRAIAAELSTSKAWEKLSDGYLVHDFEDYLDRGSAERTRKWRDAKRESEPNVTSQERHSDGSVTSRVTSQERHGDADVTRAHARRVYPVPVPEPVKKDEPPTESRPKTSPETRPVPTEPGRADVLQLCQRMVELNEERHVKPKTVTQGWLDKARLLLDRDGRDLEEALSLLEWAAHDSFWRSTILSIPKFREKYDQLRLQRERPNGTAKQAVSISQARRWEAQADRIDAQEGRL